MPSRVADLPPRVAWLLDGVRRKPLSGSRHDGRMDDRADKPGRQVQVLEVQPGTAHFEQVAILAARVLAQDRYLASRIPHALESHVLAAFDGTRCVAFLHSLVQVIGAEEAGPRYCTMTNRSWKAMSRPSESIHNDAAAE